MAALTETQLQSACRAKFPITVVKNEDYTVLTPAEIAAAWSAYSGGTDGVYLKDTDDIWYEMDPDLPKANGRGLLVFGGGKQYAQRCDFADVTEGQAFPASWWIYPGGTTIVCSDKDTEAGLPFVEMTATGTPNTAWGGLCAPPGYYKINPADVANGDVVTFRSMVSIESAPAQAYDFKTILYQSAANPPNSTAAYFAAGTAIQAKTVALTDGNQENTYSGFDFRYENALVEYASPLVAKIFPGLVSINTAFPDHVHFINTGSSTQTIVPEVVQRPWEYEGPWSVELEFETPPRNLGHNGYIYFQGETWTEGLILFWVSTGEINLISRSGAVVTGMCGTAAPVLPETTVKAVIYQTAQIIKLFIDGTKCGEWANPRSNDGMTALGHSANGWSHTFATFKSLVYRKGLATDAQLEEWSTAA